eukprot:1096924-Prymnesium_polylepis.1
MALAEGRVPVRDRPCLLQWQCHPQGAGAEQPEQDAAEAAHKGDVPPRTSASRQRQRLAPPPLSRDLAPPNSQVNFMRQWAQSVLDRVKPYRKRSPPGLALWAAHTTVAADNLSPGSAHLMGRAEHELQNMGDVTRAQGFRTCKAAQGPKKRKRIPNGECHYG